MDTEKKLRRAIEALIQIGVTGLWSAKAQLQARREIVGESFADVRQADAVHEAQVWREGGGCTSGGRA